VNEPSRDFSALDDGGLVSAIAEGDRSALAALYERYGGLLLAVASRIVGQGREAEDLLHDVFLEVWRCAADFDRRRGTVKTWLCLRMRSRAVDRRRSARISRAVTLTDCLLERRSGAQDDPSLSPDRRRVREALADLPIEQREVLVLGYFEGLSSSEIATRVGVPIGTVKSRVASARTRLRALLQPAMGRA